MKKSIRLLLAAVLLKANFFAQNSTPVNADFFGQNTWLPSVYMDFPNQKAYYPTSCSYCSTPAGWTNINGNFGSLDNYWTVTPKNGITESGGRMIRIGGIGFNENKQDPWVYRWQVEKIKGQNMIPVVQAPVGTPGNPFTASDAASIVTALNNGGPTTTTYCRYWVIGNEYNQIGWTAQQCSTKIADWSTQMRLANQPWESSGTPLIIIGPELSFYDQTWITDLTSTHNILPYIDIFSFHTYPFADERKDPTDPSVNDQGTTDQDGYFVAPTRYNIVNALSGSNPVSFANGSQLTKLETNLDNLIGTNGIITNYNTANVTNIKLAITEANICEFNDVNGSNPTEGSNNTVWGNGANGFLAGQFWADMIGLCQQKGVNFMNFWSVAEGDPSDNYARNTGYINTDPNLSPYNTTLHNKPTFWHYRLMGNRFTDTYFKCTSNFSDIKAYACTTATNIHVILLNESSHAYAQGFDATTNTPVGLPITVFFPIPYTVNLNSSVPSAAGLKVTVPGLTTTGSHTAYIRPESTVLLTFDLNGTLQTELTYRIQDVFNLVAPWIIVHNNGDPTLTVPSNTIGAMVLNQNFAINNDTKVTGTITVPNNRTLSIKNATVFFSENAKIEVLPGGRLIVDHADLTSENGKLWKGIDVKGSNQDNQQISVSHSFISRTDVAIKTEKVSNATIFETVFSGGNTALQFDRNKGFNISRSEFYGFQTAIHTSNTVANTGSEIFDNMFFDTKTTVLFENDNHLNLNIHCNIFKNYEEFAIRSESTSLKNQGTINEGAGNIFLSNSTQINDKLRHNGNAMNYYYDPTSPISLVTGTGLTAIAKPATANGACKAPVINAKLATNASNSDVGVIKSINEIEFKAYPNPFNDQLTILYTLPTNCKEGSFKIYEAATGKEIVSSILVAGENKLVLENINIAAGMYMCRILADDGTSKQFKLVNIK